MKSEIRIGFVILVVLLFTFGMNSCSPKVYPSGTEGYLMGEIPWFPREQRQRNWAAYLNDRQSHRLERKEYKEYERRKAEALKLEKNFIAQHKKKQHPEVQVRMKENERETQKRYANQRAKQNKEKRRKKLKKRFGHGR